MSETVKLSYKGETHEFPVVQGSVSDVAFDISNLRSATGLITLDVGYKNTGSTTSNVTFLDGEEGILMYRGYPIEQLAEKSNFTEVMYLLLNGELPSKTQYDQFSVDILKNGAKDGLKNIVSAFPKDAHPMGILSAATCGMSAFNPEFIKVKTPEDYYQAALALIGKFAELSAWTYRHGKGLSLTNSDKSLDYTSNFYKLMFGDENGQVDIDPVVISALDKLLILHADHEQNCSTSTVRIVGSSHASVFASVSAGIDALWGPLHGGANQAVIEMLENIKADGGDTQKWINKAKDKNDGFRLMGFGHRVYKNFDPRAKIIKKAADDVLEKLGVQDEVLDIAKGLEEAALHDPYFVERKLYPNVDFYSGIIYKALGIPKEMFTVMFALGRLPGWVAQWKEMREMGQPIGRPRQVYTGYAKRDYTEFNNR